MVAYMKSSILQQSASLLARTTSIPKVKQRISVIPLTREKIRVGQRGWKRRESRGTTDCTFQRQSPSSTREPANHSRSKQYI